MKQPILTKIRTSILLLSALLIGQITFAQDNSKSKQSTIRISVADDENSEPIQKTYRVKEMTDIQRKHFVDKVLDSLGVDATKGGKIVSVTIDDRENDRQYYNDKRKNNTKDRRHDQNALAFNWNDDFVKDFNFDTEKWRNHVRQFERDFRPKAQELAREMESFGGRIGDVWNIESKKASTVRGLDAYTNNPDNGVLNIRFQTAAKGDLLITVADVKGKEVGKKEIKDFDGNFVGQIDLKKNTKGTVFVTVVQNEDGAVKRVVIP